MIPRISRSVQSAEKCAYSKFGERFAWGNSFEHYNGIVFHASGIYRACILKLPGKHNIMQTKVSKYLVIKRIFGEKFLRAIVHPRRLPAGSKSRAQ